MFASRSIQSDVIAANVEFYRQVAFEYDRYESCTFDHDLQRMLETDLDRIAKHCVSLGRAPSCLDCGGGTGNLTLKMLSRGWTVTVVDISPEMLTILEKKLASKGFRATLVNEAIETFLDSTNQSYDLIAFSSVLHHLYSYLPIIDKAVQKISPGGYFYSTFDPVVPRFPWLMGFANSLDVMVTKLLYNRSDFLPGVSRRIRKLISREDPLYGRRVAGAGDLAEYHALTGISDFRVLGVLRDNGLEIVEHSRYAMGRTALVRALSRHFHMLESFKILAQRPLGHRVQLQSVEETKRGGRSANQPLREQNKGRLFASSVRSAIWKR
jgi:2-polyprenyl-3-methyl-5-hydroxy-6-metoxy-1,4-benzoquinol methylase